MREVQDIQEYSAAVSSFQKQHRKNDTNCYLMPGELTALIDNRKLRLLENSDALLLLCDRTDYYSLCYYIDKEASLPDLSSLCRKITADRPVLFDIIYSSGRGRRENFFLTQMLTCKMAREYKHYQRMSLNLTGLRISDFPYELCQRYHLPEKAPPHSEISSLWKNALDEKSTPLPDSEQLKELDEAGELICVKSISDDELSAVITLHIQGKQGMLQHLAVLPEHRRCGLAKCLCRMVIRQGIQSGLRTIRLWVDMENEPAISLYTQEGFVPDGMICDQYLFERSISL